MRKSKADQTLERIYITLSNISKGAAFVHEGVGNCGSRKLVRYNLKFLVWYGDAVKQTNFLRWDEI